MLGPSHIPLCLLSMHIASYQAGGTLQRKHVPCFFTNRSQPKQQPFAKLLSTDSSCALVLMFSASYRAERCQPLLS